ncbi:YheC/YheD family protein [Salipaludibacillus sp. CF4.18]|uniref:YheC/YheD family protein n=1 Tax=Salipaludibacillus sp. CF4.18 TaxID=3373081 RepID=UPI003EE4383C
MAVLLRGRNKYEMYLAMKKNKHLQLHLPNTMMWSNRNFLSMLSKYKSVVVKPNKGKQGKSIYFVDKKSDSTYVVNINKNRLVFETCEDLCSYIKNAVSKKEFIIQQEVDLAKIDGRRFDFRIIVQRKSRELPWAVTGILARKGGKGYKVTNRRRKGTVLSLEDAMSEIKEVDVNVAKVIELKKISTLAATTLGLSFPNQTIFGVDIGMNQYGSLFIFELNRWPLLGGFRSLEDKTQINRIMTIKHNS